MRVLHGPVNVGNQPYVLSRFERKLGAESSLVVNYDTWLDYPADRVLGRYGDRSKRALLRRLAFGVAAPFRYDVLHFYFGRSFLTKDDLSGSNAWWFHDLKLARRLGRTVFMTFQGCDVRISRRSSDRYDVTPCHLGRCAVATTCREVLDDRREAMLDAVLPLVDRAFVLNPELVKYVPRSTFLPYANVDVEAIEPIWPSANGTLRIVHAPSDESIKGSQLIYEAIDRLKSRHAIDFQVVRGLRHEEALAVYRTSDLVVDQVLAGWYGGLAVEVMAMGKPVAAYIRDEDLGVVPPEMRDALPIIRLHPASLEADLERAIVNRHEWRRTAEQSRAFVLEWHSPRKIAQQMLLDYASARKARGR